MAHDRQKRMQERSEQNASVPNASCQDELGQDELGRNVLGRDAPGRNPPGRDPALEDAPGRLASPKAGTGRNGRPFLLLVDDERAFADSLASRLEARGLPCLVAYRGEEALALLDRREIEVVVLDVNMPGMHGLDVLRAIKNRRPELEVLLLTGEADLAVAATGMRRGAGDYLVKPVDFPALLESLHKARKRAREHRERLRAAEAGKLMALGALAAGVGHEINNPLQIILQHSEWIEELLEDAEKGQPDYPEMLKSAKVIQSQTKRAGEITSQLLGLAHKSREGSAQADPGVCACRAVAQHQARANALGAALRLDIEAGLPLLPCSPAELEPVLGHLVRNALDAIEAAQNKAGAHAGHAFSDGDAYDPGAGHEVLVSVSAHPGRVRIRVRDTGEGIDPDLVPQIYDPFFSLRPVGKGTGLGLTVCHSIVTALRGTIQYTPAPGGGALFTVDLPAEQAPGEEESGHGARDAVTM